jgi:hypothetical protein
VTGLYFMGVVQPLGAIMPIAERQSELVTPTTQEQLRAALAASRCREIDGHRSGIEALRGQQAPHHQVDFDDYMLDLKRERKRCPPGASTPEPELPVLL